MNVTDTSLSSSPQLVTEGVAVALSPKQTVALYKKSKNSGIPFDILEEVYRRGFVADLNDKKAFDRVNSFIAGGAAANLDEDLLEDWSDSKYKNPNGGLTKAGVMAYRREHPGSKLKTAVRTEPSKLKKGSKAANRRKSFCARMSGMKKRLTSAKTAHDPDSRINKSLRAWHCHEEVDIVEKKVKEPTGDLKGACWTGYTAVGMKMKNGHKVPNCVPVKEEGYTGAEKVSKNFDEPSSRFVGTDSLTKVYKNETPGYSRVNTIKKAVRAVIKSKEK
jgi:hypothetical protein